MKKSDDSNQAEIIFLNPHVTHVGKIISHFFNGKRNYGRYRHLAFSNFIKYRVTFLFNGENSSFRRPWIRRLLSHRSLVWLEVLPWMAINKVNPFTYSLKFSPKSISTGNAILAFSTDLIHYSEKMIIELEKFNGFIYIHMTHYYLNPVKLSEIISRIKNPVLLSEGSLEENEFFRHHFKSKLDHIQIPLVIDRRFLPANAESSNRILKCLVVGSVPQINNFDYVYFFGEGAYLHPLRKILYESQDSLRNEFVCRGRFMDLAEPLKSRINNVSSEKSFFVYDSFDIVEEYKKYYMFISPEENIGLPSANFIDGMIAGSAFLGGNDAIYSGIGMIPGTHYISYSGMNLKELVETVNYYQCNPRELEAIARAGQKFAEENFSEQHVVSKLNQLFTN